MKYVEAETQGRWIRVKSASLYSMDLPLRRPDSKSGGPGWEVLGSGKIEPKRRMKGGEGVIKKASVGRLLSNDCTKVIGVGNVRLIVRFVGLCQSRWVPVWCSLSSYGPITGARRHSQTSRREGMSS